MPRPSPIVVIGAGGHGRETVSLILDLEAQSPGHWDLLGVVADDPPDQELLSRLGARYLGPVDNLRTIEADVSVAIGAGQVRRDLHSRAQSFGRRARTLIHPATSIGHAVTIGDGCYIGAQTVLTTNVHLGECVQINVSCSVSHDTTLGDNSTLAPGVHLAGGVVLEPEATVFTGATVLPGVKIGRGAVVGAGAVVTSDVAAGTTVVGVPASRHP